MFYIYMYVYIIYESLYLHIIKYKQEEAKVPLLSETRGVTSIEVRTGFARLVLCRQPPAIT